VGSVIGSPSNCDRECADVIGEVMGFVSSIFVFLRIL